MRLILFSLTLIFTAVGLWVPAAVLAIITIATLA